MELVSYFTEWQCHICEETAYIDTNIQTDELFYMDLDGEIWEKCNNYGWRLHAFCVIPCHDKIQDSLEFQRETLDYLEAQGFLCVVWMILHVNDFHHVQDLFGYMLFILLKQHFPNHSQVT